MNPASVKVSSTNPFILKSKQKHLNTRIQEYEAITDQLIATQDNAAKVTLNEKLTQLEAEINQLTNEIKGINTEETLQQKDDASQADIRREYDNTWQHKIPFIDFKPARKIFDRALFNLEEAGGATLFFLHESATMGGKWCTQALRDKLHQLQFRVAPPYEFVFEASYAIAEPEPFLNDLAKKYEVEAKQDQEDLPTYTSRIQTKIWKSLYPGTVFLLQVHIGCDVGADARFIKWFVNQFWNSFCQLLQPNQRIRLVGIISVDDKITKKCLPDSFRCTNTKFDQRKLLSLPLYKWKKDEIYDWLIDHSGLPQPPICCSQKDLDIMATNIHRKSNKGEPMTVYSQLMYEMSRKVG